MTVENMFCLGKVKYDLRDADELYFAQKEMDALLNTKTKIIKTFSTLFKDKPFNLLDEEVIRLISRLVYLGEGEGFLAELPVCEILSFVRRVTFLKEVYVIFETENDRLKFLLDKIGLDIEASKLQKEYVDLNPYTQIYLKPLHNQKKLVTLRFIPFQTLFEYATEVKKLPAVVFRPKNSENWEEYFKEKETGIDKGIDELIGHMKAGHWRAPHYGLGKNHIGDFVDVASTDLRKPFLHYLHKYKGKGDPRISRALINLLKIEEGKKILDPFVGSGAFIADGPTMGINVVGTDILRIATLISDVKCNLGIDIVKLRKCIVELFTYLDKNNDKQWKIDTTTVQKKLELHLGKKTKVYTNTLKHLKSMLFIKEGIESIVDVDECKNFLLVCLAQKALEYSEKERAYAIISNFKSYVEDRYLTLFATRKMGEILGVNFGNKYQVIRCDSTNLDMFKENSFDGLLTSPPYFDALDYVSNNKIPIILLGLDEDIGFEVDEALNNSEHIATKISDFSETNEHLFVKPSKLDIEGLPESSIELINLLEKSKRSRKAKVVAEYLLMMQKSFKECYKVLKPSKYYLMVISKYHLWTIRGQEQVIDTSKVLADLGISVGFKLVDEVIHGLSKADKGKIGVEDILVFQK